MRSDSVLMTRHHPDLVSASDWSSRVGNLLQPNSGVSQEKVNFLSEDKKIASLKEGLCTVLWWALAL